MRKVIVVALSVAVASVLFVPVAIAEEAGASPTVANLVAQCRKEAPRGHLRQLHASSIKAHRERMADLCAAWDTIGAQERQPLLERCKAEAMVAAAVRRDRVGDRGHGVRLRTLCERLYEATIDSASRSSS